MLYFANNPFTNEKLKPFAWFLRLYNSRKIK